MTTPMNDPFERRLRDFLGWQAEQLAGAPTTGQLTSRLEAHLRGDRRDGRHGGARARAFAGAPAVRLAWALLLVALLALAVAVAVIGSRDHRTAVVLPTGTPRETPPAAATATAPSAASPCPLPIEVSGHPGTTPFGTPILGAPVQVPSGALLAYLSNDMDEIRIAGGTPNILRAAATISHAEMTNTSEILGWSADGRVVLYHPRMFSGPGGPERNCSDLFLVRADGFGATKLTASGQGESAEYGALAPSGRSVAYIAESSARFELRVVDAAQVTRVLDPSACGDGKDALTPFGDGRLQWSADETYLALECLSHVRIYDPVGGPSQDFAFPAGSGEAIVMSWTAGGHVLVATDSSPAGNEPTPLKILEIDPVDSTVTKVTESDVAAVWVLGAEAGRAFSPDGRWLIVDGGLPGIPNGPSFQESLYLIDLATGATRPLDDPPLHGPVEWLPDSSGFVHLDFGNVLNQYGLDGRPELTLGSLERWGAWHWLTS